MCRQPKALMGEQLGETGQAAHWCHTPQGCCCCILPMTQLCAANRGEGGGVVVILAQQARHGRRPPPRGVLHAQLQLQLLQRWQYRHGRGGALHGTSNCDSKSA